MSMIKKVPINVFQQISLKFKLKVTCKKKNCIFYKTIISSLEYLLIYIGSLEN